MDRTKDAIEFETLALLIARKTYHASCFGEDATRFLGGIYREYLDAGSPQDCRGWIAQRLDGEFQCVHGPPEWVEEESPWPFHNDKPMVFIGQIGPIPETEATRTAYTYGNVIYLFGARLTDKLGGYRIVHTIVEQFPSFGHQGSASR